MKVLVIGGSGLIGSAVVRHFRSCLHEVLAPSHAELDLANPPVELPQVDAAVICAGPKGFRPCEAEGAIPSWRINVDGVLDIGIRLMRAGASLVFVSTDAVEWADSAYARQKAYAEIGLRAAGSPAIIRPERVTPEAVVDLAIAIHGALYCSPRVHHWP
jgi:dTDP-4-dehydrorhamnose reductase